MSSSIPHLSVVSPQVSADDQSQAEEKDKDEKSNHLVPAVTKVTLASLQLSGVRFDHRSSRGNVVNCDATKPVLSSTLNICTLSSLFQVGWLKVTLMNQMSKSDFNGSTDSKSVSTKLIPSQRKTGELYTLTEHCSANSVQ